MLKHIHKYIYIYVYLYIVYVYLYIVRIYILFHLPSKYLVKILYKNVVFLKLLFST